MKAEDFLNVSKHKAHDLAEANSFIFRLVSVDGEVILGYPEDIRTDRICVEIKSNRVIAATIQ